MKNQVQLITYPDSLGGSLSTLHDVLERFFAGLFGGVHILPPFPSSADRGFAPTTYSQIDAAFGSWDDIRRLSQRHEIMLDVMVNHISRHSAQFRDFERLGRASTYADLFITLEKIWPDGQPRPEDVQRIFLRRPEHPFVDVTLRPGGAVERVWATFGTRDMSEQIDLDVHSPLTRRFFSETFHRFADYGVSLVRLDAVAFVIKKPGTSCFFVEPEIYDFLEWIAAEAQAAGIELLLEVHADADITARLAARGYTVYNFVLPGLVLHTLLRRSGSALLRHLETCPRRQVTMLDCHDGIPVQPDLWDALSLEDARCMVDTCVARGANLSRIFSPAHLRQADFDAHQVNCTYYSALAGDDHAYLCARALQFFAPGVPQVYYNGLLAGQNTPEEVQTTSDRRAINRHNYTLAEVEAAAQKPVVQRLARLVELRSRHPAFQGKFQSSGSDRRLALAWQAGDWRIRLALDLENLNLQIFTTAAGEREQEWII